MISLRTSVWAIAVLGGLMSCIGMTHAQVPGSLDTSFLSGHMQNLANGPIQTIIALPDGKVLIGGDFTSYNGIAINRLARLNADGTLDIGFNAGGAGASSTVNSIALQSDGKILIGGNFGSYNGTARNRLARLNADGTLDTSFNAGGGGADNNIFTITVLPDGKILIGGQFTIYNGTTRNYLARLNADGTLDTSFNSGGVGFNGIVRSITLYSDGKILIGGGFTSYNGTTCNLLARLNADGTLDTSFNVGGAGANNIIRTITALSDGKVLIGGQFTIYNGTARNYLAKLNADGTLDTSFNVGGSGANASIFTITALSDGKVLIGGGFTSYNGIARNRLARLNADGTLDTGFNAGGAGANASIFTITALSDGKVLIGGGFTSYNGITRNRLARLNIDGTLDTTYNSGSSAADNIIITIAPLPDSKVLIGGHFTSYNGIVTNRLARLNVDGMLDTTYNPGGSGANSNVLMISPLPDGKVLIGGNFTSYNGIATNRLARLNADGTLDTTYNSGGSAANSNVLIIAPLSDGKVLIGGGFTSYNGVAANRLARLNADGTLDTTYNSGGSGANGAVQIIVSLPDGKTLIGGDFTSYNGITINRLARLNADGTLDMTYNSGSSAANNSVLTIVSLSDGKVLIGGNFTSYNGIATNRLARLNADGTLDTTYNSGSSAANATIQNIVSLPDGKILIGGGFTSYNGIAINRLARLNADGMLDTSFNTGGAGVDNTIRTITALPDGKVLIGGDFTSYNGEARFRIARLHGDVITCLGNIGIINILSLGVCLQGAGRVPEAPITRMDISSTLMNRYLSVLGITYRVPWRAATTNPSSTGGTVKVSGVPIPLPPLFSSQIASGDVYVVPFRPVEVGTGNAIMPLR